VRAAVPAGDASALQVFANPDLVRRLALNAPLNRWNSETFCSAGPEGYTDYPAVARIFVKS
jgi:2,4-dienoyl-CoA reductase-like NADH-dependent reductase (Old Yellow Enzyme family)